MPTDSTAESQQKVRELLEKERQVLDKYKAQVPAKHTTGRGGAGAKGHVKHKGKVPNRERALAKEREIQTKWKEDRERQGTVKTGRGGHGNILRPTSADGASTVNPRSESRLANHLPERPISTFGTTASEQRRRRRFSFNHNAGSRSGSSDYRPSFAQDSSRAPSAATNNLEMASDTDSMYDLKITTGIVTSTVDPSTILGSYSHSNQTATSVAANRLLNHIAPFEELIIPQARKRLSLQIGFKAPKDTNSATTTPTTSALTPSQPHSLLRPFKKLHIGKQPDSQDMPSNDILDISASAAATSIPSNHNPERPTEINSHTTAHHYPHYRHATETTSAASAALQMIDPSNRTFIPPSGTVSPPPIPTPVLAIPEKRYSFPYPYTFNIDELRGDDNDTASYVDTASYIDDDRNGDISRRTSGTFGFTNSNVSFISTSPSTPTVPSASPPILPALYFQLPVPPRREDISWAKRRLPVPPVDSHRVLRPTSTHSGLLSPPQTPLGNEFTSSRATTPTPTPY